MSRSPRSEPGPEGSNPLKQHRARNSRRPCRSGSPVAAIIRRRAVALANKTARIAWAVMLRQKEYQPRALAA